MLSVVKLDDRARLPEVAHPGEDIGYDLFALEDTSLIPNGVTKVRTGIAAQASWRGCEPCGLLIRDRSSVAMKGIFVVGGVIDAGYTGEICVCLYDLGNLSRIWEHKIKAGQKIAQMVPVPVLTGEVIETDSLGKTQRAKRGFGSTDA